MKGALRTLGVIYLIAAVILAVVIIYNYGTVEVGVYYAHAETNPIAIGCSVGVIFQGLLVFCLALGLAQVIDKCEEITYKLNTISSVESTNNSYNNSSISNIANRYKQCSNCGTLNEESAKWCRGCNGYLRNSDIVIK